MIVSHKYKFIFLKTRKTAGTSIEIALSKFCGNEDIVTPITPEDEEIRRNLGYPGPRNYVIPFRRYGWNDWYKWSRFGTRPEFYNHMPAGQIRQWIGKKTWDSYYKFCFERNPWDKAISLYYFLQRTEKTKVPFEEFLYQVDKNQLSNFPIYTLNNQIAVDHVGLYENIEQEIKKISEQLGFPFNLELPRAKQAFRKDRRPYQEIIGEEEKQYIRQICQKEIALFEYSFDGIQADEL
jgi:hypothetical protein